MDNPFSRIRQPRQEPVGVVGLGRFGSTLALALAEEGVEVLGIDTDPKVVREHATLLTEAAVADGTDEEALEQLGFFDLSTVVVAVGHHLEVSILTAATLAERGVESIWARADTAAHARILERVGVHHVVRPEYDTGRRVAHLLDGRIREFAEIARDYSVVAMIAPQAVTKTPDQLFTEYGVQIVSVKRERAWQPVRSTADLRPGDLITVAGSPNALERFSNLLSAQDH
ncbi:potassium channel family protein [Corynebacterium tapiri]|uniref:TrkA family potassium uptake protein n=1 Tax=Corynebacterium tapiri TaxID=1448266 RepID=A0A5C4U4E6_9CORY|nr:TrkA family potassium uptake protein [Corynebacterium tapiri]TNL97405.1 TrkA family potassium uptake protein [Corynebacterium tapiri]